MCYWKLIFIFLKAINLMHTLGDTLIITKYRGDNGYKSQPRAQGYSLGHETAQEYLARHNMR